MGANCTRGWRARIARDALMDFLLLRSSVI
jgi:hypothetical protein